MSMNTQNVDIIKLLPAFMRDDCAARGLSAPLSDMVHEISATLDLLSTWDHLDTLPEKDLDELAWEINLLWYNKAASMDIKRSIVRNGFLTHSKLGTKWAVENVIATYFGVGIIREWWEYAGNPGHFKVLSTNPTITNERLDEFLLLLEKTKRLTAKLDGVFITLTNKLYLYFGFAYHDVTHERHRIGADIIIE